MIGAENEKTLAAAKHIVGDRDPKSDLGAIMVTLEGTHNMAGEPETAWARDISGLMYQTHQVGVSDD